MKTLLLFLCTIPLLITSCDNKPSQVVDHDAISGEITAVERAFADMVADQGMATAFLHFADDDAVLLRGRQVVEGKAAIEEWFEGQSYSDIELTWAPDFVKVAEAGDLAYTYGEYQFTARDTAGEPVTSTGIFHTIWARQTDGSWKYVWD